MADKGENEELTIAKDIVVTKYKMAADIVNNLMSTLISQCVPGANVLDICEFGDKTIIEETSKVFKKEKEMKKGIAFPTCVSVNNCICHFSPLKSEPDLLLKNEDVVKIDLGAHIDGFPAVLAHTFVVGASAKNKVKGKKADVILAAHNSLEAAKRLVKPGNQNDILSTHIQKITDSYNCKPVEGMLSYKLQQHTIDGDKTILLNPTEGQRKEQEKSEFEVHEVYGLDVLISTGEGKGRESDTRTTVFKRKDSIYQLKMKASRQFFSEVEKKFGTMPFSLRSFDEEKKARMGVVECVKHDLVEPFTVLYDREGESVAQFKCTSLLMPNGPMVITGIPFERDHYQSDHTISDKEIKTLLSSSTSAKAAKRKKKKAEKQVVEAAATPAES